MDSHKIVDDLKVSLSLCYVITMCSGHPDRSVNLGQWDAEVRQGGKCFSRLRAVSGQQTCRLSVLGKSLRQLWVSSLVGVAEPQFVWAVLEYLQHP